MKYLFLIISIFSSYSFAEVCRPEPLELTLQQFTQRDVTLPLNGQVRIYTQDEVPQVVDVFTTGSNNFGGLEFSHEVVPYVDERNFLAKIIFKKPAEPDKVYMTIKLSENAMRERLGYSKILNITMSFKYKNRTYKTPLSFSGSISYGCKF